MPTYVLDKLLRMMKLIRFRDINFRKLVILIFLQEKLSRKKVEFAEVSLANVSPIKVIIKIKSVRR